MRDLVCPRPGTARANVYLLCTFFAAVLVSAREARLRLPGRFRSWERHFASTRARSRVEERRLNLAMASDRLPHTSVRWRIIAKHRRRQSARTITARQRRHFAMQRAYEAARALVRGYVDIRRALAFASVVSPCLGTWTAKRALASWASDGRAAERALTPAVVHALRQDANWRGVTDALDGGALRLGTG